MNHENLTLELLLQLQEPVGLVPLSLTPDGQLLALSVKSERQAHQEKGEGRGYGANGVPLSMIGSRVFLVDTASGAVEEPFPAGSTSWGGQWSPDGTRLAAYVQKDGEVCLGIWERANKHFRLFPQVHVRPFFGFEVPQWTWNSQTVVIKLRATHQPVAPIEQTQKHDVTVFSFVPETSASITDNEQNPMPGWADGYLCNLAQVNVTTGEVLVLAEDWRIIGGWKIAPGSDEVALFRYTSFDRHQLFLYDLTVLSLEHGTSRVLVQRVPQDYGLGLSWSPDGRWLAYTARKGVPSRNITGLSISKAGLFVVAADGSRDPQELSDPSTPLELCDGERQTPRWSEDGQALFCLEYDGCWMSTLNGGQRRKVALVGEHDAVGWVQPPPSAIPWTLSGLETFVVTRHQQTKEMGLVHLSMSSGESTLLLQKSAFIRYPSFETVASLDSSTVYLLMEQSNERAAIWQLDHGPRRLHRLLTLNAQFADVPLGTSRLLTYQMPDGEPRQAVLLLPSEYGEGTAVPMVVAVYGGLTPSSFPHVFGGFPNVVSGQWLASHGYGVLYPDLPLTETGDSMRQLAEQVRPAITHLIERGIADPQRLGLMGHSYGGYSVLALLVQLPLFSAAVASAGAYDLISMSLTLQEDGSDATHWSEFGQGGLRGSLWEKRTAYLENSPIFFLDQVQAPVLLLCGSADSAVPPEQSGEAFAGLRRLGKTVTYRQYAGEEHDLETWSEPHYRDLYTSVLRWFGEHLRKER